MLLPCNRLLLFIHALYVICLHGLYTLCKNCMPLATCHTTSHNHMPSHIACPYTTSIVTSKVFKVTSKVFKVFFFQPNLLLGSLYSELLWCQLTGARRLLFQPALPTVRRHEQLRGSSVQCLCAESRLLCSLSPCQGVPLALPGSPAIPHRDSAGSPRRAAGPWDKQTAFTRPLPSTKALSSWAGSGGKAP